MLEGYRAQVWIEPATAEWLVIGGLPRSRLPLLLGLVVIALGLSAAAIVLWRRERALATLRSEFVSRVSHELRTPLSQIRMFAETLLLGRIRGPDEERRSLEIIDREARRLTHLVENILQFSRGERGATQLRPEDRDVDALVRQVVEELRPLLASDRVTLETSLGGARARVDDGAMRQVLLNLLDNAVKYGPSRQTVRIGTATVGDDVRITVEDEGPGIPDRDRERIWRRFQRLDREQERASAGTGIGLAVVRELVAAQGGRTRVETGDRGGARFVVELPHAPGVGA